ncbi:MAG: DMT family transporter [Olegusella sp.]|nr:DMT family transporter [Olegusella sp.]
MSRSFKKYLASLLMFGSNGIVASAIALPSSEVVLMRTLLGALLLVAVLAVSLRRSDSHLASVDHPRQALSLAISGAALGISWIFLFAAYRLIGVGIATLAYYIGPVIVMALSPILFKESLTPVKLMGFAAVVAGAFLVVAQGGAGSINAGGLALGGMAALMYAVMVVFSKRASDVGGVEAATVQIVASFAAVAVYSVATGQLPAVSELVSADLPAVITLGLVNTGLGCYLYFSAMGVLPVQRVAVFGYLEPLSAVVLSALVLGEAMGPVRILGATLIIGGAASCELLGQRTFRLGRRSHAARPVASGAAARA